MKAKQDKKVLNKIIENRMDVEFKKLRVHTHVYHFRDMKTYPFNGVTVVTGNVKYHKATIATFIKNVSDIKGFSPATHLLEKLSELYDIHGVAICDKRDPFSRQEGRLRAKRRLLRHLKGRDKTKA